jgi:hypothetical protein
MLDTTALKERVDLVAMIGGDVELRQVAAGEYAGPCPKCGGKDRLHVNGAGWWMCRQCHDKRGDAIEYLQWRDGLAFADACAVLADGRPLPTTAAPKTARTPTQRAAEQPPAQWQQTAAALVGWAERRLWGDADALGYLRGRGLTDETITAAHLGYIPEGRDGDAAKWGRSVRIPAGWVIPCYAGGALQYVKVRRKDGKPKYQAIGGGPTGGAVYGLDLLPATYADLVLCEGEINALILRQCLAPVCAVLSVGAAGNLPGGPALGAIARARRLWSLFDHDTAGDKGAGDLLAAFERARALSWPWGERGEKYDLNDAHRDGENLAAWAIPQVGPTDAEARALWARYWLDYGPLDDAANAARDDADPALCLWCALLAEYERVTL